ncbi:MAG: ABC transporter transmembrane domain-containing protein [Gammaproteobacteria bacterium]
MQGINWLDWCKWLYYTCRGKHSRYTLWVLILATFFINILSLVFPLALLQFYDRIIPREAMETFYLLVLIVIAAIFFEAFLRIARSVVTIWCDSRFEFLASCEAFEHLQRVPLEEYEREGSGLHYERFNSLSHLKDLYAGQTLVAIIDIPFMAIYLVVIAMIGGWLWVIPFLIMVLFVVRASYTTENLRNLLTQRRLINERRSNFLIDAISNMHAVKALAIEANMQRRYERLQTSNVECQTQLRSQQSENQLFCLLMTQITFVFVAIFGAWQVIEQQLSIGALAACMLLAGRCLQPIKKIYAIWNQLQGMQLAEKNFKRITDLPQEDTQYEPPNIKGAIELKNVSFGFDKKPILKDINLSIKPGEAIAITGESLSGKTTLLYCMLGIIQPDSGKVKIDDLAINVFDKAMLRQQISYLPQEGKLFAGTILENLTRFGDKKLQQRAKQLSEIIGLHKFIARLPNGYNTYIKNQNDSLIPRGIKQQIVIIRGLITKPGIILFDEANVAIDMRTDKALLEFLRKIKGQTTLILVSNRPSLINLADKKYQLVNGNLICTLI